MSPMRVAGLSALAMLAFACNSLLCRMALKETGMDAATFTSTRLISGAAVLWLIAQWRRRGEARPGGDWQSAAALFGYAATFSYAYASLTAATGALLLFGAVQATMLGYGLWAGERLRPGQLAGLALAIGGLAALMAPGVAAPPAGGALLMVCAGVGWGIYSLRGRGAKDPLGVTAGNFLRAAALTVVLSAALAGQARWDPAGLAYGVASGAVASGLGYIIWYAALPALTATSAAIMQLSVPVIAALGGALLLDEALSLHVVLSAAAILGGIALVVLQKPAAPRQASPGDAPR
ncbi:DMT family transporter [Pulveribacter suum]|uniref:EamA family transporter n=1 Tax=Pulveribacter suum TaxID=2116657 RepID=A0A2P1NN01_9BURK|nr:DMT family transporter [Pulveribacter suum]AVP58393.1 EamA family transporter [Pulveribacter suum]